MWLLALLVREGEHYKQDLDLLKRIQRRDQKALSLLYDRYAPILFPLSLRVVSSRDEAEEILQEVFLQVWEKADTYVAERGSVYSWVVTICRNRSIDRIRSRNFKKKTKEVGLEASQSVPDSNRSSNPHDLVVLKGYAETVREALKSLSSLEMKILELSYYEGHSQSEIAAMLKLPLGTVKTKMRKGLQKLRQIVGEEGKS
ncbi:MAG: sigma-70 family RNA polymerase sigma factor [Bacteroidota bacterium]